MSYGLAERRRNILENLRERFSVECIVSIVASPYAETQQQFSTMLQHTRDISLVMSLLNKDYGYCNEMLLLINSYNSTIQFPEHLIKRLKSYGVSTVYVGVLDSALSLSALVPLLSDKILLLPWSVLGTVDPYISTHNAPREALLVKEAVEQTMASMPKEAGSGKGQVLYALSVSGSLYEYVVSEKYIKYVERLLYDFVKERTTEERFSELIQRILVDPSIHDQPLTAKDLVEMLPYASIVKGSAKVLMAEYFSIAVDSLHRNNNAIIIETPRYAYTVPVPTPVYTY